MGALSCGCEGAADLEEGVPDGIVEFHFANVFALEDMVSMGVKGNTTVAACVEKNWGETRETELALEGNGEGVIGEAIVGH